MISNISRGLKRLQKAARMNRMSVEDTAWSVMRGEIHSDDRLREEVLEFAYRFKGSPATGDAYVSADGTETYLKVSNQKEIIGKRRKTPVFRHGDIRCVRR